MSPTPIRHQNRTIMIRYKLVKRGFANSSTAPKKYYATHVNKGRKSLKHISLDLEQKSALNRGDIGSFLENLTDQLPVYLLDGQIVSLGDFGSFRLSLNSEGVESPESFTVGMINKLKIIFIPGKRLKEKLEKATFEKVKL